MNTKIETLRAKNSLDEEYLIYPKTLVSAVTNENEDTFENIVKEIANQAIEDANIEVDLSGYVKTEVLDGYAKTTEIPDVNNYVNTDNLATALSDYYKKNEVYSIEEVDEKITNIINGTTPAGNALKLNGKEAKEYMKFVGTVDASFINGYERANPYIAHVSSPTAVELGLPSDYHKILYIPDNADGYATQIAFPANDFTIVPHYRHCGSGIWHGWKVFGDGCNAMTLNGLTAEEFVKGVSPHFASGETILDWATNPNGIYKKFIIEGVYPSDAPIQQEGFCELSIDGSKHRKQVKFTPYRINKYPIYERSIFQGAWNTEWTKPNDGGNADTVDGYHASDFIHLTNGKVAGITKFDTVHMVGKGGMEGGEIQFAVPETGHSYDSTMVTQDVYGDLVRFFATHDGITKGLNIDFRTLSYSSEAIHSHNIGNYALPLTGGTLTGNLVNTGGFFLRNRVVDGKVYGAMMDVQGNGTSAGLYYSIDGSIKSVIRLLSNKVLFELNGTSHTALHTGNSLKVQASNDAPTDTATMWYDTANKTWKRYVDGAWQA